MATTTPNYGWTVPTSTDLVKDGATAIETLGDAIDASMNTALGTKKAGMVLLNTTSFSGVASQSINDVFSATYDSYLINIAGESFTGSDNFRMRFRVASADNSTNNYSSVVRGFSSQQASLFLANVGGDFFYIGQFDSGNTSALNLFVNFPFASKKKSIHGTGNGMQGGYQAAVHQTGTFNTTTSFTGFTIYPAAGNMTGRVSVYGLAQ
jgi:hypothetical protein